ncbi:hypothetical protein PMAYCL1PPCAC_33526, partial [Pristionchus mayeri]
SRSTCPPSSSSLSSSSVWLPSCRRLHRPSAPPPTTPDAPSGCRVASATPISTLRPRSSSTAEPSAACAKQLTVSCSYEMVNPRIMICVVMQQ